MSVLDFCLWAVSSATALVFGFGIARLACVKDVPGFIVAALVGAAAQIILISQLLSLAGLFMRWPLVLAQLLSIVGLSFVLNRVASLPRMRRPARPDLKQLASNAISVIRSQPLASLVVTVVSAAILFEAFLVVAVPPNTWDSMTYHLTRAAFWIQNHSLAQFANSNESQAAFPINAEVLQAWMMMTADSDRFPGLIQWTSQIGVLAFVVAAARDLNFGRIPSLFAASVTAAIPLVVAQSTSTQNDLTVSFFIVAAFLFCWRAMRGKDERALWIGTAALGLAVGTKTLALPAVLVVGITVLRLSGWNWRQVIRPAVAAIVCIIAFGSYNYIQNVIHRDSVLGAPAQSDLLRVDSVGDIPGNALRIGWSALASMPGVEAAVFERIAEDSAKATIGFVEQNPVWEGEEFKLEVNHRLFEDRVGIGLIGIFLLIPISLIAISGRYGRDARWWAMMSLLMFGLIVSTIKYNHWTDRFMMQAAFLAMPLVAIICRREGGRVLAAIAVLVCLPPVLLDNQNKPVVPHASEWSIFEHQRIGQIAKVNDAEVAALQTFEILVPNRASVGIVADPDSWIFPYFGPNFDRHLIKLNPAEVGPGVFEVYDIDAIMLSGDAAAHPNGLDGTRIDDTHFLALRQ